MAAVGTLPRSLARSTGPKHQVHYNTYKQTVPCDFCQKPLAGFFRQGLKCKGCSKNFHKDCLTNAANVCLPGSEDGLVMPRPPAPLKPTAPVASTQAAQPTNPPPTQQTQQKPAAAAASVPLAPLPTPAPESAPIASSSYDAPLYANISDMVKALNPPAQVLAATPPAPAQVAAVATPAAAPRPTPAERSRGPSITTLSSQPNMIPQVPVGPVPMPRPRAEPTPVTPAAEPSRGVVSGQAAPAGSNNIKQFLHNYIKDLSLSDTDDDEDMPPSAPAYTNAPAQPAQPAASGLPQYINISNIVQPQVSPIPPVQPQAPPPASSGFAPDRSSSMRRAPQPAAAVSPLEAARVWLNLADTVLERAPFFHPLAPSLSQQERREYAANKLKDQADGSWLLRSSHGDYILVVKYGTLVKNVRILKTPAQKYWIVEAEEFDSVIELLAHYTTEYLAKDVPVPLLYPVPYTP